MFRPDLFSEVGAVITVIDILLQYLEYGPRCKGRQLLARVLRFWFLMFARIIVSGFFAR